MAGGISVHAVDVANGRPAAGMRVEVIGLSGGRRLMAEGKLNHQGALEHPINHGENVTAGDYEALFHVGDFLRGTQSPHDGFLDLVVFRFRIADASEHFHLPLKFTPWGYSLFRGS
jgi:5-hydroxyisourate hydrolase